MTKATPYKRTAMNLFMHFATSHASFIRVIGRRLAVKSVVETCGEREIKANWMGRFWRLHLRMPG
jgi:hypothetical protein